MTSQDREAYKAGYDAIDWSRHKPLEREEIRFESKAASHIPCPMVMNDGLERPAWGPDGKLHTSKSTLRASYRPSGNPKGESYIEVGNEKLPEPPKHKASSDADIDKSIHKALARLGGV